MKDSTVFLSLLLILMYASFCFGVGGFPVIECRTANSASVLNFLRISIKARGGGGSWGKKCPILIFQYVIQLKKNEQDAKNGKLI